MSLFTSSQFAACSAAGTDWRDTSKSVLEQLEGARGPGFNFGFLYISDHLSADGESIRNLFASVLNIENWIGCVGIGVCANNRALIDMPAISAMIGRFENDDFCLFPALSSADCAAAQARLKPWMAKNMPLLVFAHGDPMAEEDPAHSLKRLEEISEGFIAGGLSSSRREHILFSGGAQQGGVSGAAFSHRVKVASTLSQGCTPIGPAHTITQGDDHIIRELDKKNVVEVFEDDLRTMTMKKIAMDPDLILLGEEALDDPANVPPEMQGLFKGEVSIAFPISESDQNDFLVRNIASINEDGSMTVSQEVMNGERVVFVHRNDDTLYQDLSKRLVELRERVQKETGSFAPKGAVYVSCVARSFSEQGDSGGEMKLIREIIGDVPLAGFYAGGEISSGRLYGYTGVMTLFL